MANNKFISNFSQFGRSMIEMIGVLAIIGVLSVGGIAGYSKAMTNYKINKCAEQLKNIQFGIMSLYENQKNYSGIDCISGAESGCNVLKKLNIIPEEMWKNGKIVNAFGGKVSIKASDHNKQTSAAYTIVFEGLPPEAIIYFATQKSNIANTEMLKIHIN
ncbi:MAG: hypothetical protein ILA52_00060 [Alphaproteobacteria bacterium]|nr:hypothetical protein [Alphaproteobacteria bacterium]